MRKILLLGVVVGLVNLIGCDTAIKKPTEGGRKFELGDMIDPFTPPTLEELNAKVEWVDKPVLDAMELLREKQKTEQLLATAKEALGLANIDRESNEKILSALGRLPADDKEVSWDAPINRHSGADINSTFPLFVSSAIEQDVNGLTGGGLFGFDWNFTNFATKESVKSWQSSSDGLYDKIVMRDDLTWSDGKPFTAHDVVYSYQAIMTKAMPIKAVRQGTDQLKWVHAYDDYTVVFFHKESLVTNINNANFPVIPKHVYESVLPTDPTLKNHPKMEDNPVVLGSYVIAARDRGQEIRLERRESYYMHKGTQVRDKPYFKTIRFRIRPEEGAALLALKTGDIDEMMLSPEFWQNQTNDDEFYKKNTKAYATEWTNFQFTWNLKDPRFAEAKVRKALALAFDHDELLDKQLYGLCEPCTGNFHPTSKWAPKPAPSPIKRDLKKAEELLSAAGWIDSNNDGVRDKTIDGKRIDFDFIVLCPNIPNRIAICNLLKSSLDRIGIRCTVKALDFAVVVEKLHSKSFQAAFGGWGSGTDPDTSENLFATGQERNYGSYSNAEVDELFKAGKREFDPEKRVKIYQRIAEILWEDQPFCWLYYRNAFYGFNKDLRGYMFSPRGPFHYGPGFGSIYKIAEQP